MRKIISYAEDPGAANFLLPLHKELCNAGFNSVSLVSQELNEYAKIKKELGWTPKTNFNIGIKETINWYISKK